ncbi:hypothetical protein BESB_028710 [Besnoitia besnoiti]|uniref:Uncharacterized protein n=1 Tax=Besnoitia besnoiti TaxID=94643 RepID=A0A2A9M6D3_BESBE|nr:uncharacterized protein BESB_028710 [Besnoitia besnoiti]PFH31436.1 hypothetical protein BESB_028710 [Besnoitia besnoiti]
MIRLARPRLFVFHVCASALLPINILSSSGQFLLDESAEYYPAVKPFEAGKFQSFIPYAAQPLTPLQKTGVQLASSPAVALFEGSATDYRDVLAVIQTNWRKPEVSNQPVTQDVSSPPIGESVPDKKPSLVRSRSASLPAVQKEKDEQADSSASSKAERVAETALSLIEEGQSLSSPWHRPNTPVEVLNVHTTGKTATGIKAQVLPEQYGPHGGIVNDSIIRTMNHEAVIEEAKWDFYFPKAELITKANDFVRRFGVDSPGLTSPTQKQK